MRTVSNLIQLRKQLMELTKKTKPRIKPLRSLYLHLMIHMALDHALEQS